MSEKQKLGILFNNRKTRTFERAIKSAGFEFEVMSHSPGKSMMFIDCEKEKVKDIAKICRKLKISSKPKI